MDLSKHPDHGTSGTYEQKERMSRIPYASAVGSLMYAMLCTRPDICYVVGVFFI